MWCPIFFSLKNVVRPKNFFTLHSVLGGVFVAEHAARPRLQGGPDQGLRPPLQPDIAHVGTVRGSRHFEQQGGARQRSTVLQRGSGPEDDRTVESVARDGGQPEIHDEQDIDKEHLAR